MRPCPSCHTEVAADSAFCTNCGSNMHAAPASVVCASCGRQNNPGVKFCGGCGSQIASAPNIAAPGYAPSGQYPPQSQPQYTQPYAQQTQQQYPPQQQYTQPYPQQYAQPQQYPQQAQGGYQQQPMLGQQPMVLRCPTCMAMAPLGSPQCVSCRTSLSGIVPTPANMPAQGQQGGFFQSNNGKLAMGALGGAAAVIGGEMLLHGLENNIENRVEDDMGGGYGESRHHHRRDEGLLGGLGELANDIGL